MSSEKGEVVLARPILSPERGSSLIIEGEEKTKEKVEENIDEILGR